MKTNCRRRHLTFGEFIMAVYDAYGKQAEGMVRLAVNARLVYVMQPPPHRVIVQTES